MKSEIRLESEANTRNEQEAAAAISATISSEVANGELFAESGQIEHRIDRHLKWNSAKFMK